MKKYVIFALALCLVVSVVALAACQQGDGDIAACTLLGEWPDGVLEIQFNDTDGGSWGILDKHTSRIPDLPKGYVNVMVLLSSPQDAVGLRILIDGVDQPLGELYKENMCYYRFGYNITKDFTIGIVGGTSSSDGTLSVEAVPTEYVTIMPDGVHIQEGAPEGVELHVRLEGNRYPDLGEVLTATSDAPNIARTDGDGRPQSYGNQDATFYIQAVAAGTAHITIATPKQSKTITIVVEPLAPVQASELTLDKTSMRIYNGWDNASTSFLSTCRLTDPEDIGRAFDFSVSDESVIKVSKYSLSSDADNTLVSQSYSVTPLKAGNATVTVTAGEQSATLSVTVVEKPEEVTGSTGLEITETYSFGNSPRGYYVTGWGSCTAENLVIPNVYNGERVWGVNFSSYYWGDYSPKTAVIAEGVEVLSGAFRNMDELTSVTLPESLTTIGDSTFLNCSALEHINLENVARINGSAFSGCTALQSVTLGNSLSILGISAFASSGLTSITLPDSVTSIGDSCFRYCEQLERVELSDSLTELPERVFESCYKLQALEIPQGVTHIGAYAFSRCASLTEMTLPEGITEIAEQLFSGCSRLASVNIPSGVTTIGASAFSSCESLHMPELPQTVSSIGNYAFSGCGITELTLTSDITYGNAVFTDNRIESIYVPDMAMLSDCWHVLLDDGGFYLADGYKVYIGEEKTPLEGTAEITADAIPDSFLERYAHITSLTLDAQEIGSKAFGNSELQSVTLKNTVQIGNSAFYECMSLREIHLPSTLRTMEYAFRDSGKLKVYVSTLLDWLNIDGRAQSTEFELYVNDALLEGEVEVPAEAAKIPAYAFAYNAHITEVRVASGVKEIADYAFYVCSQLRTITLPDSLETVGDDAIMSCEELVTIECSDALHLDNLRLSGCDKFKGKLDETGRCYSFGGKIRGVAEGVTYLVVPSGAAFTPNALEGATSLRYIYIDDVSALQGVVSQGAALTIIYKTGNLNGSGATLEPKVNSECTPDGWVYEVSDDSFQNVTILAYIGDAADGELTVPAQIEEHYVTNISFLNDYSKGCFFKDPDIHKITIASREMQVTSASFAGLTGLTELALTGESFSVVMANKQAPVNKTFDSCTALMISLPENYTFSASYRTQATGTATPLEGTDILTILKGLGDVYLFTAELEELGTPIDTVVGKTFVFKTAKLNTSTATAPGMLDSLIEQYRNSTLVFDAEGGTGTWNGIGQNGEGSSFTYTFEGTSGSITLAGMGTLSFTIEYDKLILNMDIPANPISYSLVYVLT